MIGPSVLAADTTEGLSGISGLALTVIESLGEVGVGALILLETVFPPIPSEIVLPLAGFLVQQGNMNLVLVLITATLGGLLGAYVLYFLGRKLGEERVIRGMSRLPLVERSDFEKSTKWFHRHGRSAVLFGRLIPGVRSLISIPAGSSRMPLATFTLFTVLGSLIWNSLLIGLGALLGTQYQLVDRYSVYLNYAVWAALAGTVIWLIVRRIRRSRLGRQRDDGTG